MWPLGDIGGAVLGRVSAVERVCGVHSWRPGAAETALQHKDIWRFGSRGGPCVRPCSRRDTGQRVGGFSVDLFSFLFGSILLVSTSDAILIISNKCRNCGHAAGVSQAAPAHIVQRRARKNLRHQRDRVKLSVRNPCRGDGGDIHAASGNTADTALIVIPNITAMLFGTGFKRTVGISVSMSVFSAVSGILLSYYLNIAPSGTIVMITVAILLGTLACRSMGLISKVQIREPSKISHNA